MNEEINIPYVRSNQTLRVDGDPLVSAIEFFYSKLRNELIR
jgi:hypothetical protein